MTDGPGSTTTTSGECFTAGCCDNTGPELTDTLYGVASPEECQGECANRANCHFFTW